MDIDDWEAHYRAAAAAPGSPQTGRVDPLVEEIAAGLFQDRLPTAPAHQKDHPAHHTRRTPHHIPRALDLACGAGANALWLAEHGWQVTAVDRSPAAIELVRAMAARRGAPVAARVTTHIADLETHEFTIAPGAWDLILMCRYLQRDLFEPAKLGLAPGGVLIAIALLAEPDSERSTTPRFRVEPGELAAYFSTSAGWTIIHRREGTTREHRVAEIAVRRDEIR